MSRFPELRRIESAIEHQNIAELKWALNYCETRLKHARLKQHKKSWQQRKDKVQAALDGEH